MTALHAAPAASPVRTRRADRAASTGPRNNAPSARRPREATWWPVAAPAACSDVVPEREVSFEEFAAGFLFVDAATGHPVAAGDVADLDTVRVIRRRPGAAQASAPAPQLTAAPVSAASGAAAAPAPRYEWTPRGLAVLLALVALVVGIVATTVVTSFLAISPEPLQTSSQVAAPLAFSVGAPGR